MAKKQAAPAFFEKTKTLNIKPFNYRLKVVVSNDIVRSATRYNITVDDGWYAMHVYTTGPRSIIFVPIDCGVATVAHEVSHCTWRIFKCIGAEFENEVMAYLNGYIVGEIVSFMKQHRKQGWKTVRTKH